MEHEERFLPTQFERHLTNNKIHLYIVAGTTFRILEERGTLKSLQQNSVTYQTLRVRQATDAINFQDDFVTSLLESLN
ncbi:MAG: hypothetical protein IIB07_03265 [Bacteroidetes bacterium]|nr:hypothetical protein [Bacteroidota bacterium]